MFRLILTSGATFALGTAALEAFADAGTTGELSASGLGLLIATIVSAAFAGMALVNLIVDDAVRGAL